jgi:hypothetical protein
MNDQKRILLIKVLMLIQASLVVFLLLYFAYRRLDVGRV